ncbi:hypothetical protein [Bacillus sp. FJAT-27225]|nr:hypothetical protein [Bacillus sp. FJAT-27225]
MYKLFFTAFLLVIAGRTLWILIGNKRKTGSYQDLDERLVKKLNEGEFHG